MKQRLCIFLDGTWNTENNSTNVQHLFNLTIEGEVKGKDKKGEVEAVFQKKFYDRGVGTGLKDGITGGVFGAGIDENIREAYIWILQNYNPNDEIFIFGFSRGAFAARSLVGLIKICGLLRRGAPIPISQIWDYYVTYRDKRDQKKNNVVVLAQDTLDQEYWHSGDWKYKTRPEIKYVGVFDTVGALGLSALGIPGVMSKSDRKHNYLPTGIVKKMHHAIAIDEHRSSFAVTPIEEYIPINHYEKDLFSENIKQMWFVGAHSNIGGGYSDNYLSLEPLVWIMDEAKNQGLVMEHYDTTSKSPIHKIRDSYSEFSRLFWPHILREKRNYRKIFQFDKSRPRYKLRSINENVHPSVYKYFDENEDYAPPNLMAHLEEIGDSRTKIKTSRFEWLALSNFWSMFALVMWSVIAGLGLHATIQTTNQYVNYCTIYLLLGCSIYIIITDYLESLFGYLKARYPKNIWYDTIWNASMWHRYVSLAFFLLGLCSILYNMPEVLMNIYNGNFDHKTFCVSGTLFRHFMLFMIPLIVIISIIGVVQSYFNGLRIKEYFDKIILWTMLASGFVIVMSEYFLFPIVSDEYINLYPRISDGSYSKIFCADNTARFWSILLVICLLYILFWVYQWTRLSMSWRRSGIGRMLDLQLTYNRDQIEKLFTEWRSKLVVTTNEEPNPPEEQNEHLQYIVRKRLIRDTFGMIPAYIFTFSMIFWASTRYHEVLDDPMYNITFGNVSIYIFLLIPFALDLLENYLHWTQLSNFIDENKSINNFKAKISFIISAVKNFALFLLLSTSVVILLLGILDFLNCASLGILNYLLLLLVVGVLLGLWEKRILV